MYMSVCHNDFNPHNVIISEKTRNNVMEGSDFHRLIFSDEHCSTNGIYIKLYGDDNIKYGKQNEIHFLLKISGIWASNQANDFGLTFRFFIFNNQF